METIAQIGTAIFIIGTLIGALALAGFTIALLIHIPFWISKAYKDRTSHTETFPEDKTDYRCVQNSFSRPLPPSAIKNTSAFYRFRTRILEIFLVIYALLTVSGLLRSPLYVSQHLLDDLMEALPYFYAFALFIFLILKAIKTLLCKAASCLPKKNYAVFLKYIFFIFLIPLAAYGWFVGFLFAAGYPLSPPERPLYQIRTETVPLAYHDQNPITGKKLVFDGQDIRIEIGQKDLAEFYAAECKSANAARTRDIPCTKIQNALTILEKQEVYTTPYDPKKFVSGLIGNRGCLMGCHVRAKDITVEQTVGSILETGKLALFNKQKQHYERHVLITDTYNSSSVSTTVETTNGLLVYGPNGGIVGSIIY